MIVIYGPPGVGKSTIIRHFALLGVRAVDLENFSAQEAEWAAGNWSRGSLPAIIGGAGLMPHHFPKRKDIAHLLLLPDRTVYDARRAARDARVPHKAGQPDVYDNFKAARHLFDAISPTGVLLHESLEEVNRVHRALFKRDIPGY